jgi:hypothetical protein
VCSCVAGTSAFRVALAQHGASTGTRTHTRAAAPRPPRPLPLQILAGKLKPNLGRFESAPDWEEILGYFRGSELQNYFTKVLEDNLKVRG